MLKPTYQNRVRGMVLGQAVGDALGATLESQKADPLFKRTEMIGGGTHGWRPGQPTDDTDLMLAVLRSIPNIETFDLGRMRAELITWFDAEPIDVGSTIRKGITRLKRRHEFAGTYEEYEQGNGSLMRCAPLAILDTDDATLSRIVRDQTRLTHAHVTCILADQIFISGLRAALSGGSRSEVLKSLLDKASAIGWREQHLLRAPHLRWENLPSGGWAVNSLAVMVWSLANCASFEEALVKVVNLGGDADTNAAVSAAMWGAFEGARSIPNRWLGKIEVRDSVEFEVDRLGFPRD